MADSEYQQQLLMLDNVSGLITSAAAPGSISVTDASNTLNTSNIDHVEVNADLLQQALQEASNFDQEEMTSGVEYHTNETNGHLNETGTTESSGNIGSVSDISDIQYTSIDQVTTSTTTDAITSTTTEQPDTNKDLENDEGETSNATQIDPSSTWQTENREPPKENDPNAIVGSAKNPIQIIQHGNTYTSTQVLSAEQLQQIAQVLQQQHLVQTATKAGTSSILFNPQTNTRIVYKVIYPSDMHKEGASDGKTSDISAPVKRKRGRPPKHAKKVTDDEEEEEKERDQELTREEKEEKKRMCPRTRSGRVSRPPLHMVISLDICRCMNSL